MHSEEDVKIKFLLPFLNGLGYKSATCDFNVPIKVQEGRKEKTIFADAVVYSSPKKRVALLLCETKSPYEVLNRSSREQAISYARLLPQMPPLTLLTNGLQTQVYHTITKQRLQGLPPKADLTQDLVRYTLSDEQLRFLRSEAKHNLFIIDDVGAFKSILEACHNAIRNNDGMDPTQAFDEMSKLLFCKLHEERRPAGENRFTLAAYDKAQRDLNINIIQAVFDETKVDPRYTGLFDSTTTIALHPRTIRRIVELFQDYDLALTAFDVKGEAFEYFLSDTFTGGLGEFFTPRNVVEFMVGAVEPKIGHKIIDPFCGTGGFLLYSFDVVSERIRLSDFADEQRAVLILDLSSRSLFGSDWKDRTSQACKMNMTMHGDGSAGIVKHDGLTDVPGLIEESNFDLCLTNPPFGSTETNPDVLSRYELGAGRKSQERVILAIERALRLVKPKGFIAIVMIDGVLNNTSTRYVREFIQREADLKAVVSLAPETFLGYGAGAKTSVLILQRREVPRLDGEAHAEPVFMAIAANTGYAPNGDAIPGNELPDILVDYRTWVTTGVLQSPSSTSWLCSVGDRLDAEHYVAKSTSLKNSLEVLASTQKAISALASSTSLLEQVQAAVSAIGGEEITWTECAIGDLLCEVVDPVVVEKSGAQMYKTLGVSQLALGAFVREAKLGRDIKAKKLFRTHKGNLIYNRLFAFKGSFAVLRVEHDDCYVSGEFPLFTFRDDAPLDADQLVRSAVMEFIVFTLISEPYLHRIDRESTGSTKGSRNRFNQKLFLKLPLYLPTVQSKAIELVAAFRAADDAFVEQKRAIETLKRLRRDVTFMLPSPGP
jgi:type I restriction enzyme M protein